MKKFSIYLTLLILILMTETVTATQFLPLNQDEYRFIYSALRRDEISGGFYNFNYNIGPYNIDDLTIGKSFLSLDHAIDQDKLKLFTIISEHATIRKDTGPLYYESLRGGFTAQPIKNFQIYSNFVLDESMAENPNYTGKKYRGLAGEMENAFIAYRTKNIEMIFGRFGSFWGPTSEPVVFSSTARPMDAFSFRFNWGKLHYSYQIARLERYDDQISDSEYVSYGRYFAGHRLDFRLLDNFNLGLFETIIFSGIGQGLDLAYLNPLLFYHSFQLNENSDQNTFLGIDFCWYLENKHKIYGQLMIDDYQVDDKEPGDKEPDEIGYIIGAESIDFFDYFDCRLEYLKITNRTFNQAKPANRYINRGGLIGNELGPDGDRISLVISKWLRQYQRLQLGFEYTRNGEGSYNDEWTAPWLEVEGDYSEPFPTGTVEKTTTVYLDFESFFCNRLYLNLTAGLDNIKNSDHIDNHDQTVPFFRLCISVGLSTLVDID